MRTWIAAAPLAAVLMFAAVVASPVASHAGGSSLARARADSASKAFGLAKARLTAGASTSEVVCAWSLRWFQAEKAAGNANAAAEHLARLQALESDVNVQFKAGIAGAFDQATVAYYRADAEALAAGQ